MNIEKARELFVAIDATTHEELRRDLFERAVNFAHCRSQWPLLGFEERRDLDPTRTAAHNAFVDACNILSRNMAYAEEGNGWRVTLGEDRGTIGDFACFVSLFLGLRGR